MTLKRRTTQILSGVLTAVTLFSNVLSPMVTYAAENTDTAIPYYKDIKDQLDADEVVTAKDIELTVGSTFDVKADFSGIEIPDENKVKVKFMEAQNEEGQDFSTDHEDTYQAVYYVEPQTTDHPTYQISRMIVVKDVALEADTTANSDGSSDHDSGSGEMEEESEDTESESSAEIPMEVISESELVEVETTESETETETEIMTEGTQLTDEEFDAEIESTENQDTVDPETGVSLSDVLTEADNQDISILDLEIGESVSYEMPVMFAATRASDNTVTVKRGDWYYYADYGLGSYITSPFYVTWGSMKATAYCVQPSKPGPEDGTYTITKLSDSKTLAKVCYYGTKASDENGFFDEKHPDFSTGKRFVITHIAAAL